MKAITLSNPGNSTEYNTYFVANQQDCGKLHYLGFRVNDTVLPAELKMIPALHMRCTCQEYRLIRPELNDEKITDETAFRTLIEQQIKKHPVVRMSTINIDIKGR